MAAFDRQELIERMDGDEALCDDLLRLFVLDAPAALARIKGAVAGADEAQLQREAHTLRGAAAYVAARPIQRLAEQLERIGREGRLERAGVLVHRLSLEVSRLLDRV